MNRDETLHRVCELGELRLYGIELTSRVELAPERIAEVVHASAGPVVHVERATAWAAEGAARVVVGARRWNEIMRARSCMCERGELVVVEQVGRHARAAVSAVVAAPRPRLAGRTRAARSDRAQLGSDGELSCADRVCERCFFSVDVTSPLLAQPTTERDQLVGPRLRLANFDEETLDSDAHAVTVALR